jgi:hypothetical protein
MSNQSLRELRRNIFHATRLPQAGHLSAKISQRNDMKATLMRENGIRVVLAIPHWANLCGWLACHINNRNNKPATAISTRNKSIFQTCLVRVIQFSILPYLKHDRDALLCVSSCKPDSIAEEKKWLYNRQEQLRWKAKRCAKWSYSYLVLLSTYSVYIFLS